MLVLKPRIDGALMRPFGLTCLNDSQSTPVFCAHGQNGKDRKPVHLFTHYKTANGIVAR